MGGHPARPHRGDGLVSRIVRAVPAPAAGDADARERARLELAASAARAERKNRPTYLVFIALLLVAASGVALVWALGARASEESALRDERAQAQEYDRSSARIQQIRSTTGEKANPFTDNNDRIRTRIMAAAERAGLTGEPPGMTAASAVAPTLVSTDPRTPGSADGTVPPTQRSKFRYENVRQQSLEILIQWLNFAVEDIPGLEVYSIHLKPEANGWVLTSVTFTRWERVAP